MDSAENCTGTCKFAKSGYVCKYIFLGKLAENFFTEEGSDLFHFCGNGSVIVRKVCVGAACVYNAEVVSVGSKIKLDLFADGIFGICKVYVNKAAASAGDLVHKSAGLAEMYVFCVL